MATKEVREIAALPWTTDKVWRKGDRWGIYSDGVLIGLFFREEDAKACRDAMNENGKLHHAIKAMSDYYVDPNTPPENQAERRVLAIMAEAGY